MNPMTNYQSLRTARLQLRAYTDTDLDELYALHSDPAVWAHFSQGRHVDRARTAQLLAAGRGEWQATGLGYWTARSPEDEHLLGVGGCALRTGERGGWWNLYYRFAPAAQGQGLASELVAAALAAARDLEPDAPVVARLLEHNASSKALAERAGLMLAWRGPDAKDPESVRLIYADRDLAGPMLALVRAEP
jgi:RimJ/RimL family protein N-acetyltransferase